MRNNLFCFFLFVLFLPSIVLTAQNINKSDSLLSVLNSTKSDTTKINTMSALSYLYSSSDTAKALAFANQGEELARKINYQKGIAKCLNNIGIVYKNTGNYKRALEKYQNAFDIYSEISDKKGMAKCYTIIGTANSEQGIYNKAIENYQNALLLYEEIKDKKEKSRCYVNIGIIYKDQGNYPKAIEQYLNALKIYEEIKDKKGISSCYSSMGIIHNKQNNFDQALVYFKKTLAISEELNDKKGISACYNNFGICYGKLGAKFKNQDSIKKSKEYNQIAIDYYRKALQIRKEIGDKKGMASCYNNIGIICKDLEDYPKAIEYSQMAYNQFEELGMQDEKSVVLANLAELNIILKNYKAAIDFAEKSLKIAKQIGSLENERFAYEKLSTAHKNSGKYKEALLYHELYTRINDSIFNKEKSKQFIEIESKYENVKNQKEIELLNKDKELQRVEIKQQNTQKYAFIVGLALMMFLIIVLLSSYQIKRKANILLEKQKQIIESKNEALNKQNIEIAEKSEKITETNTRILDSIHYAKTIQNAVLPPKEIFQLLFTDYFVFFKPKDIVSGDFYYISKRNKWTLVAVADCTGHGVPGAFMSMLGISFLNEIVARDEIQTAGQLLNKLRDYVTTSLKQKGEFGEQKDGMDIAFCAINTETMELHFAGANNPVWIVKKVESCKVESEKNTENNFINFTNFKTLQTNDFTSFELYELKGDKQPIGIYVRMEPFTNHIIKLEKGDLIYMMSDGYEDQFGGPMKKKFYSKNLKQLLLANNEETLEKQQEILDKTLKNWRNNYMKKYEQTDDITVVGIRI